MKQLLALFFFGVAIAAVGQPTDQKYYEMRIYYAASGKLEALIKRFTDHTTKLFEKHGMENVGYWVPVNNTQNALYYILSYPNKPARAKAWENFGKDPEWAKVKSESETNGKLVDSVKSVFMTGAGLLPAIKMTAASPERVFELRIYHCQPGRLPALKTRFRDHTLKLFEKHGMENICYFDSEAPEGKQPDLVYLIAHKTQESGVKSWEGFLADPVWAKVRDDSEKDGKIIEKIDAVVMKPLAISKIR